MFFAFFRYKTKISLHLGAQALDTHSEIPSKLKIFFLKSIFVCLNLVSHIQYPYLPLKTYSNLTADWLRPNWVKFLPACISCYPMANHQNLLFQLLVLSFLVQQRFGSLRLRSNFQWMRWDQAYVPAGSSGIRCLHYLSKLVCSFVLFSFMASRHPVWPHVPLLLGAFRNESN